MRKLMLVSSMMLLIAGQTMGQSTVTYELEVGGNNNGATCANPVYFTPGQTTDGDAQLDANGRLTWAVRVRSSGTHLNAAGNPVNIRGVANFVFDLELYNYDAGQPGGMGTLVNTASFMSTANANTADCGVEQDWSNAAIAATYLSNAAFAYSFKVPNVATNPPARAIDWFVADANGHKAGGLRMDVRCYPKETGAGKLLGMGAGYSAWNKGDMAKYSIAGLGRGEFESRNGYQNTATAKQSGDSVWGWQGFGPVCEGQIEGLVVGQTYVLRIVPGGGINVVRNEATSYAEVFATAATNASAEDTITFTVRPVETPVHITGWYSVKSHNGVEYGIPLNPTPTVGQAGIVSETRLHGIQKIVVEFDKDARFAGNNLAAIQLSNGLSLTVPAYFTADGMSLVLETTGSVDTFCYAIDLNGAIDANELAAGTDLDCLVQDLAGDVNNSGSVLNSDVSAVKSKIGLPVTAETAKYDVNHGGTIVNGDMSAVKARVGIAAECF